MKRNHHFLVFIVVLVSFFVLSVPSLEARSLKGLFIMIDPGHGGVDSGAIGPGGLTEKDVNLRVAKYLKQLLLADGAKVMMTRDTDLSLTLPQRLDIINKYPLDLFISIHHNASLEKSVKNRGEVFYNAFDENTSRKIAEYISKGILANGLANESIVIPGGFFLLRNNPWPSVLTEAGFMTIPKNEKLLRTGKSLTTEAEIIREAVKKVFELPPLKVEAISTRPAITSSPYFNIIFTSNKPLVFAEIKNQEYCACEFGFEKLPTLGNFYCLYNQTPLDSGEYNITTLFKSKDGTSSFPGKLKILVRSSQIKISLNPISDFIPEGFIGTFPISLSLKDSNGSPVREEKPFQFSFNSKIATSSTRSDGKAIILLNLDGKQKEKIDLSVSITENSSASIQIPVRNSERTFILGRVISPLAPKGLERVKIKYAPNKAIFTIMGGYFFCELSTFFGNLKLTLYPPPGYKSDAIVLKTGGEKFFRPEIVISPVNALFFGKKIAILADRSQDPWIRGFVKSLMNAGADVTRLRVPVEAEKPVSEAIKQANQIQDLSLIISIKQEDSKTISLRHYHRGGTGKKILDTLLQNLLKEKYKPSIAVSPGSDYELGHSGASAVVISFPTTVKFEIAKKLLDELYIILGNLI
ncbi:MAG: N-acetylmuramoyl-L-alanine amidase [Candidatus Riflebacteria bacterium]|nr:N-acetylmuramoyl-L-alanine amidase [Candidatus Riflebacteria bacterium]